MEAQELKAGPVHPSSVAAPLRASLLDSSAGGGSAIPLSNIALKRNHLNKNVYTHNFFYISSNFI